MIIVDPIFLHCDYVGDCWESRYTVSNLGRVYKRYKGKYRILARVVAHVYLGLDLTDSKTYVCHHCDNMKCINPAHLFLGTARDNTLDMHRKKRNYVQQKHAITKLNSPPNETDKKFIALYESGMGAGKAAVAVGYVYQYGYELRKMFKDYINKEQSSSIKRGE